MGSTFVQKDSVNNSKMLIFKCKFAEEIKNSWKRVKMATKGTPSHTTQRCTSPPGLLAFVPLKEQNDFSNYLYSQYLLWNKERRRLLHSTKILQTFKI